LLIVVSAPLFIAFQGHGYFRDTGQDRFDDAIRSPDFTAIKRALHDPEAFPVHHYTGLAEADAAFLLGELLATQTQIASLVKSNDVSWQQLTNNNALFIGGPRYHDEILHELPAQMEMEMVSVGKTGLRILRPKSGEPAFLADDYAVITPRYIEDGEAYALISHLPGPNGKGDVVSFSSNLYAGSLAAVESFVDRESARELFDSLAKSFGEIPRYYQVALKVRFRDGLPINRSYMICRKLQPAAPTTAATR
jgi:hypothetical protein